MYRGQTGSSEDSAKVIHTNERDSGWHLYRDLKRLWVSVWGSHRGSILEHMLLAAIPGHPYTGYCKEPGVMTLAMTDGQNAG